MIKQVLDRFHSLCAKSESAVRISLKIRNQTQRIIGCYLTDGNDQGQNGENALIEVVRPHCSRIMDVGANIGNWCGSFLSGHQGNPGLQIAAYEPGHFALDKLRVRFGDDPRIIMRPVAVGRVPGRIAFYEDDQDHTRSSMAVQQASPSTIKRDVEVVTLRDEVAHLGWTGIDYLKIDAEGYDLDVLRGAKELLENQSIRFIQFEYGATWQAAGATLKAALLLLESSGYTSCLIKKAGLAPVDWKRYGEYFSFSNIFAFLPRDEALFRNRIIHLA